MAAADRGGDCLHLAARRDANVCVARRSDHRRRCTLARDHRQGCARQRAAALLLHPDAEVGAIGLVHAGDLLPVRGGAAGPAFFGVVDPYPERDGRTHQPGLAVRTWPAAVRQHLDCVDGSRAPGPSAGALHLQPLRARLSLPGSLPAGVAGGSALRDAAADRKSIAGVRAMSRRWLLQLRSGGGADADHAAAVDRDAVVSG